MRHTYFGLWSAGFLLSLGCGQEMKDVGLAEVNRDAQDASGSWPRIGMVAYSNVGFKYVLDTFYVDKADEAKEFTWQRGALESFVLYPYCKVSFYERGGEHSNRYNVAQEDFPYYNHAASSNHRDDWHKARVNCTSALPVEDAMVYGDPGLKGDKIPVFRGKDHDFKWWFSENASSIDVGYGKYVVVYKDGKRHSTAIGRADLANLGNDSDLSRTEVYWATTDVPETGCNRPRSCYRDSSECSMDSEDVVTYDSEHTGDLAACDANEGQSYCTGDGYCVSAESGEPVLLQF